MGLNPLPLHGQLCQDDGLKAGSNTSATMTRNVDDKGYWLCIHMQITYIYAHGHIYINIPYTIICTPIYMYSVISSYMNTYTLYSHSHLQTFTISHIYIYSHIYIWTYIHSHYLTYIYAKHTYIYIYIYIITHIYIYICTNIYISLITHT